MEKIYNFTYNHFNTKEKAASSLFSLIILFISITSFFHVMDYWKLTNGYPFYFITALATELFIIGSMLAINKTRVVWLTFILGAIVQALGNVFYSYFSINPTDPKFIAFTEMFQPIFQLMYGDELEVIHYKRALSLFNGLFYAVAPIVFLWAKITLNAVPVVIATPADATPADATPADATPADATPADATPADADYPKSLPPFPSDLKEVIYNNWNTDIEAELIKTLYEELPDGLTMKIPDPIIISPSTPQTSISELENPSYKGMNEFPIDTESLIPLSERYVYQHVDAESELTEMLNDKVNADIEVLHNESPKTDEPEIVSPSTILKDIYTEITTEDLPPIIMDSSKSDMIKKIKHVKNLTKDIPVKLKD